MDAALRVYSDATFQAESGSLSGILNTSLGDILRYSYSVTENPGTMEDSAHNHIDRDDVGFFFTSLDYGIQDGYFHTPIQPDGTPQGDLLMKNLQNTDVVELVNPGSYAGLMVTNFKIEYVASGHGGNRGNYFDITYDIINQDHSRTRSVEYIVRRMNE